MQFACQNLYSRIINDKVSLRVEFSSRPSHNIPIYILPLDFLSSYHFSFWLQL